MLFISSQTIDKLIQFKLSKSFRLTYFAVVQRIKQKLPELRIYIGALAKTFNHLIGVPLNFRWLCDRTKSCNGKDGIT